MSKIDELLHLPLEDLIRPTQAGHELTRLLVNRGQIPQIPLGVFLERVEERYAEIRPKGFKLIHAIADVLGSP